MPPGGLDFHAVVRTRWTNIRGAEVNASPPARPMSAIALADYSVSAAPALPELGHDIRTLLCAHTHTVQLPNMGEHVSISYPLTIQQLSINNSTTIQQPISTNIQKLYFYWFSARKRGRGKIINIFWDHHSCAKT
jgi:hypothetical protein